MFKAASKIGGIAAIGQIKLIPFNVNDTHAYVNAYARLKVYFGIVEDFTHTRTFTDVYHTKPKKILISKALRGTCGF